jgi:hypothetical protein
VFRKICKGFSPYCLLSLAGCTLRSDFPIPIVWLIILVLVTSVRWPGSTDEAE